MFESDRFGFSLDAEYQSAGDWAVSATQFGISGRTSYAFDVGYQARDGQRINNDFENFNLNLQVKQQLSPADFLYFQTVYSDLEAGDVRQIFDQDSASSGLRLEEVQKPLIFAGYRHEWGPGNQTLLFGGWLNDEFSLNEPDAAFLTFLRDPSGQIDEAEFVGRFELDFESVFEAFTFEIQQIVQFPNLTVIAGGRYQCGVTETASKINRNPFAFPPIFPDPPADQSNNTDLARTAAYLYSTWKLRDSAWLTLGFSHDSLDFPINVNAPPISDRHEAVDQISPKVGILWAPDPDLTIRGSYTESLGGLFFDSSIRLEPTQIAGFNQAFRSLIPESVGGAIAGSRFQGAGIGAELELASRSYLTVQGEILESEARRFFGVFDFVREPPFAALPSQTPQKLDFEERSVTATYTQLFGEFWSLGVRYKWAEAELVTAFVEIPQAADVFSARTRSILLEARLFANINHPSGLFGTFEGLWTSQSNFELDLELPGDSFWQFNLKAGYRTKNRRGEIRFEVRNIGNRDYQINPLSLFLELPRETTFVLGVKYNL